MLLEVIVSEYAVFVVFIKSWEGKLRWTKKKNWKKYELEYPTKENQIVWRLTWFDSFYLAINKQNYSFDENVADDCLELFVLLRIGM